MNLHPHRKQFATMLTMLALLVMMGVAGATATGGECSFCGVDASGKAHTFDLSSLPTTTNTVPDARGVSSICMVHMSANVQ